MNILKALKQSMFKQIQGRHLLVTYIVIIMVTIMNIDTSDWDITKWISLLCATSLPVIAELFNIETPSSINLFRKIMEILKKSDVSPDIKLKLIENEIIIMVNEWNNVIEKTLSNNKN